MSKGLLIIDVQNDYFPEGKFPLWNAEGTLSNIEQAIRRAEARHVPIVLVQHIANPSKGTSPFFNQDTEGVKIHPRLLAALPGAPIVIKEFADSFLNTTLEKTLSELGITDLVICGMMTQNCVTHTAISKTAEKYKVSVLGDCCTTVSEMIHCIALNALSLRVPMLAAEDAF